MAVLRTPAVTDVYGNPIPVLDPALEHARLRAEIRAHTRWLVRRGIAQLVYSTGYPLLALALWIGARDGNWTRASVLVALGVLMSFIGWGLLSATGTVRDGAATVEGERGTVGSNVFLALYNRAGAIVVLIGSYAVTASTQGWPMPQSFVGWFALVWVPLFVSFAIPVECATRKRDVDE
jgi:hypothetical protein